MTHIRAFIALPSDRAVIARAMELQRELSHVRTEIRWEPAEKLHVTLKFLGETEKETVEELHDALKKELRAMATASPLELTFTTIGVFPHPSNPRVIWMGAEPNAILLAVQDSIERVCERFGFKKEERAFHPHLTIGRIKGREHLVNLTDRVKTITFEPVKLLCTQILIMQSQLHPAGSRYSILKTIPLI